MGRRGEHYTAQQFIDAIPGTGGIITVIAKRVGCSWHTAKRYVDTYATVQQAHQDEQEAILDLAEARTIEEVEHDDDYVIVRIYRDDSIFVDDREATSEQELLVQLREARQGSPGGGTTGPSNLLVMADGDCRETVVMALVRARRSAWKASADDRRFRRSLGSTSAGEAFHETETEAN